MINEINFMNTLVKIENLIYRKSDEQKSILADNILQYGTGYHLLFSKILKIETELTDEGLKESFNDLSKLYHLKGFFYTLCTHPESAIGKKIKSIQNLYGLDDMTIKLFKGIFLLSECEEEIYFQKYLEAKFNCQIEVATNLSHLFDLSYEFIYTEIFRPESSLCRLKFLNYSEPALQVSFYLRRFLLDPSTNDFETFLYDLPANFMTEKAFPFSDARNKEIDDFAELYLKNKNFSSMLFTHSDALAFQVANQISEKTRLKILYVDISPDSPRWEIQYHSLRILNFLELKDRIIFIRLNYQIERLESMGSIITTLENLLSKQHSRIIIYPENYQQRSTIHTELIHKIDRYINFVKSDKETRRKVYESKLNGEMLEDVFYQAEINNHNLQKILRLDLTKKELEAQIRFFSDVDDLAIPTQKKLSINYEFFNTNFSPFDLKAAVKRYIDFDENTKEIIGRSSFLLHGPPGTGKSFLAEAICIELGLTYKKVRLTDFSSPYVHETEKKARDFFAENANFQVLIFDEFDSLTLKRENSQRHHEITEVNEILNCIDEYKGIIFATTNNFEFIDPAALRRFDFKVNFDFLTSIMARDMFISVFNRLSLKTDEISLIEKMFKSYRNLTPAIIANIHRQSLLMGDNDLRSILLRLDEYVKSQKESIRLVNAL